jgi:type I restriction enzyme S subunit
MSFTESLEDIIKENENKLLGSHPSWERIPLSYIASILNGFAFPSSQFSKDRGKPLLRIRDILKNKTEAYFEGEYDPLYIVNKGDLIIGMDGDFQCALWNGSEALLNQRVCKINLVEEYYNKKFLALLLPGYLSAINAATSSVTVKHLSSRTISEIPIPLPPLPEQHRIVARIEEFFSRLDVGVQALRRARSQLQRYRQSVLTAAVTGRLTAEWRAAHPEVEPADELLDRIARKKEAASRGRKIRKDSINDEQSKIQCKLPETWTWAKWGQIGISQNGRLFPSKEYQSHGYKLLRPGNLHSSGKVVWTLENTRYLDESWAKNFPSFIVGPRELVMNLTAQSLKDEFLGRICITGDSDCCLLNQRIARLTPIEILPEYLLWMFKSQVFRKFVNSLNTGSLIQHMFTSQLDNFYLPLPPLQEQLHVVSEINLCFSKSDNADSTISKNLLIVESLRQSILQRAFQGNLVPQDPDDEPASMLLKRILEERAIRMREPKPIKRSKRRDYSMSKTRSGLYEILMEAKTQLSPHELFNKAGFHKETIDEFYQELREEVNQMRIIEIRPNKTDVYLKVVENENK